MKFYRTAGLVLAAAFSLTAFTAAALAQQPQREESKGVKVRGHVVALEKGHFVLRNADNKELTLLVTDRTRFFLDKRTVRFADLHLDASIEATYDQINGQNSAYLVTILPKVAPGQFVEGEVIRVVEPESHFIVRVKGGQEVIVFADPRTVFTLDDQPVRLVDLRSGMIVKAKVNLRDKRHHAQTVVITPRPPK
jgi:hypothetical protein